MARRRSLPVMLVTILLVVCSSTGLVGADPGDSDGDGVPDAVEGTTDTDGDGNPDYLARD